MLKSLIAVALSLAAVSPALADGPAVAATPGKMLLDVHGARLAPVYRVVGDGSVEIVFEGRMVTVPAATLSSNSGKLMTSLTKTDVIALQ